MRAVKVGVPHCGAQEDCKVRSCWLAPFLVGCSQASAVHERGQSFEEAQDANYSKVASARLSGNLLGELRGWIQPPPPITHFPSGCEPLSACDPTTRGREASLLKVARDVLFASQPAAVSIAESLAKMMEYVNSSIIPILWETREQHVRIGNVQLLGT